MDIIKEILESELWKEMLKVEQQVAEAEKTFGEGDVLFMYEFLLKRARHALNEKYGRENMREALHFDQVTVMMEQ